MFNLRKEVETVLNESVRLNFGNIQFVMKLDANEDPNKKGIKIQFVPVEYGQIDQTQYNDIAEELKRRINTGLLSQGFNLTLERDRQIRDKTIISLFLHIDGFDKIIRQALLARSEPKQQQQLPQQTQNVQQKQKVQNT